MAKSNLFLLGTIHSDPLGYGRVRKFLSDFHPDTVLVEVSPFALEYRQENSFRLLKDLRFNLEEASRNLLMPLRIALRHTRIKAIMRQITLPFEYRAAAAYAAREGPASIVSVDSSEFSEHWIEKWNELISVKNLQTLLELDSFEIPERLRYEQAARSIRGEPSATDLWSSKDIFLWQERENRLAANLTAALDSLEPTRPLYIGGWSHLCSGGELKSLRSILQIEISHCFLLDRDSLSLVS